MSKNLKIGVIGGDKRIVETVKKLCSKDFCVSVWGIDPEYIDSALIKDSCEDTVTGADVVILPIPPSEDEVRVNCPLFSQESGVKIHKLLDMLHENTLLLGGRISPRLKDLAAKRNLKCIDYFNTEELLIKNAVPTAEGAIGIAVNKMPKTIFNSKIAIVGFGRIGEALALRLKALGANITVFARKGISIAQAEGKGMSGVKIVYENSVSTLNKLAMNFDLIYNTVPYWLITEDIIKLLPKSTLIVDLASAPGGVDLIAAKKYGTNVIHALALPSKTAPISAGEYISESIINIITEEIL